MPVSCQTAGKQQLLLHNGLQVLRRLRVISNSDFIDHILDLLPRFSKLEELDLSSEPGIRRLAALNRGDWNSDEDAEGCAAESSGSTRSWAREGFLAMLPAVEKLELMGLDVAQVSAAAAPAALLSRLTRLKLYSCCHVEVTSSLPRLRELWLGAVADLSSEQLQLPQLTWLYLAGRAAKVRFSSMPQLAQLETLNLQKLATSDFTTLSHLSSLGLALFSASPRATQLANWLLQEAPSSVSSLCFYYYGLGNPLSFSHMTQLTAFSTDAPRLVKELAPLSQLQQLNILRNSAANLKLEDIAALAKVTSLTKLSFHEKPMGACLEKLKVRVTLDWLSGCWLMCLST